MNQVILSGRLVKDPELVHTGDFVKCDFSLAVNSGKEKADFINCIAWGKTAENLCKYEKKGSQILIRGNLVTNNYTDKNGTKRYETKVNADLIEFMGSPKDQQQGPEDHPKEASPYLNKTEYEAMIKQGKEETRAMFEKQGSVKSVEEIMRTITRVENDDLPF